MTTIVALQQAHASSWVHGTPTHSDNTHRYTPRYPCSHRPVRSCFAVKQLSPTRARTRTQNTVAQIAPSPTPPLPLAVVATSSAHVPINIRWGRSLAGLTETSLGYGRERGGAARSCWEWIGQEHCVQTVSSRGRPPRVRQSICVKTTTRRG
jgi:hypothetical protein